MARGTDGTVSGMGARSVKPTILAAGSFEATGLSSDAAELIGASRGKVVSVDAEAVTAWFADPRDAVAWATEVRRRGEFSAQARWGLDASDDPSNDPRHASWRRAIRIASVASPRQILLSRGAADLLDRLLPPDFRLNDRGDVRPIDLGRPERIVELLVEDGATPLPLRSLDDIPNNLPIQATTFVGRDVQLRELERAVLDHHLVTLTGPGGCGKTRLGLQLAGAVAARFPDGVWVVDLATVTDPALIFSQLAEATGADITRRGAERTVIEQLSGARSLLVLDNCEHLVDASADAVERLVGACPLLTILVTSREPLGAHGETTWRVPSLTTPRAELDLNDIRDCEAVRLFVERAQSARSTFHLDEQNSSAVAEICRRLDGIPLAIELAAARCRAFPPAAIALQLRERFDLLTGGRNAALPRHQTLEASFEWSYALLDDVQRVLLRRLSVFVGGFDLEAAEAIAGFEPLDAWAVLDALTALVDKSLVVVSDEHAGRLSLLETMRQFAMTRLIDAGEVQLVRQRHAEHYADMSEALAHDLEGPSMAPTLRALEIDIDNLRCALDWWVQQGEVERATRMSAALWLFWTYRPKEGIARLRATLALEGAEPASRSRALLALAHLVFYRGDLGAAQTLAQQARDAAESAGDERAVGRALTTLAKCRQLTSASDDVLDLFDEALTCHRATGDDYFRVYSLSWRVLGAIQFGDGHLLRATVDEMLSVADSSRNPQMVVQALVLGSAAAYFLGDAATTLERSEAALAMATEIRNEIGVTLALVMIARVRGLRGQYEDASAGAAKAAARSQAIANVFGVATATWVDALNRSEQGDSGASDVIERAHGLQELLADAGFVFSCELAPAMVRSLVPAGSSERAAELIDGLAERARRPALAGGRARIALAQAMLALHTDDVATARRAAFEALDGAVGMPSSFLAVSVLEFLAHTAVLTRRWREGARLYGAASAERRRLGVPVPPADKPGQEEDFASIDRAIGADGLAAALAEGADMDVNAAGAYARRGRGSRRRSVSGWSSLTPAELDVTRLVAEGLRNAEVAEKLFVTEATVKTHLVHIFAKLGLSSRAELAALARDR